MKLERRAFSFELRAQESPVIAGHAALFNTDADIGGYYVERISPGAFSESIGADDIRALFNHSPDYVLGRNKAGTLRLDEDERGLAIEIDPPDTQLARDLVTSIKRGDISQMSFGFFTKDAEWKTENGKDVRILKKVQLFDVSPVTFPAYSQTDVSVRSAADILAERPPGHQPGQVVNPCNEPLLRYLELIATRNEFALRSEARKRK